MALNNREYAAVAAIHQAHTAGVTAARMDGGLSAEGRADAMDQNFDGAENALDELYARANQRDSADGQAAYSKAFGLPPHADGSTVLSHRDAVDRVSGASAAEAARLLDGALNRGDETMARAVGERALHMAGPADIGGQWASVLERFASSAPARQQAVGTLAGQIADRQDTVRMIQERHLRHVRRPVEIQHGDARARAAAARAAGNQA